MRLRTPPDDPAGGGAGDRNSFGNRGSMVSPADVARLRPAAKARGPVPWTVEVLRAIYPQPVGPEKEWTVTAGANPADAKLAIDGKFDSRWCSKIDQAPGMWVRVELPRETTVGGLWIDAVKSANNFPRAYKVEVSPDGETWGKPVAEGKGAAGVLEIRFAPVKAKFVRTTQTGKLKGKETGVPWSISEPRVLGPPTTPSPGAGHAAK